MKEGRDQGRYWLLYYQRWRWLCWWWLNLWDFKRWWKIIKFGMKRKIQKRNVSMGMEEKKIEAENYSIKDAEAKRWSLRRMREKYDDNFSSSSCSSFLSKILGLCHRNFFSSHSQHDICRKVSFLSSFQWEDDGKVNNGW